MKEKLKKERRKKTSMKREKKVAEKYNNREFDIKRSQRMRVKGMPRGKRKGREQKTTKCE